MRSLSLRRSPRVCDPAPSRWSWRLQRLMLTPTFLLFLRAGVPMALTFGLASWWLSDEANRRMIADTVVEARAAFETRPEFMVQLMAIDGASEALAADIREVVPLNLPTSQFDLNLETIRAAISELAPVQSVAVRIRPGGVLQIDVVPRRAVAIWRRPDGLFLVDGEGIDLGQIVNRNVRQDLPLIAGEGAAGHVPEALTLYGAAEPLGARLRGLVWMGGRRWDVVLDRQQRILLPEIDPVQALERVIALDSAEDILSRDIRRVDLRLGARPTVQMSKQATDAWWDIRQVSGQ